MTSLLVAAMGWFCAVEPLEPGDFTRKLIVDDIERSYLVHVPAAYDAARPVPVVLCLHGAVTDGRFQQRLTGLNETADAKGFIVVYPNGTGPSDAVRFWNAGAFGGRSPLSQRDDVGFIRALLDDLATVANFDSRRVYACGLSNGGMMCHRLAIELSDRIAAIAPVAGTLALPDPKPARPVPVMQIHGTLDTFVPYRATAEASSWGWKFRDVDETIAFWVKRNGCLPTPHKETLPDVAPDDGTTVERYTYKAADAESAEVVLVKIVDGGHTWPGREMRLNVVGRTTHDVKANDLIWEFFERHSLK